jgi:hypothetical protein
MLELGRWLDGIGEGVGLWQVTNAQSVASYGHGEPPPRLSGSIHLLGYVAHRRYRYWVFGYSSGSLRQGYDWVGGLVCS